MLLSSLLYAMSLVASPAVLGALPLFLFRDKGKPRRLRMLEYVLIGGYVVAVAAAVVLEMFFSCPVQFPVRAAVPVGQPGFDYFDYGCPLWRQIAQDISPIPILAVVGGAVALFLAEIIDDVRRKTGVFRALWSTPFLFLIPFVGVLAFIVWQVEFVSHFIVR